MYKERNIKVIGGVIIAVLFIAVISLVWILVLNNQESSSSTNTDTNDDVTSLPEPESVDSILNDEPNRFSNYTRQSYNTAVEQINESILDLKRFPEYNPTQEQCLALSEAKGIVGLEFPSMKVDETYFPLGEQLEPIYNELATLNEGCRQHLRGSTGLFEEYKVAYEELIPSLETYPLDQE